MRTRRRMPRTPRDGTTRSGGPPLDIASAPVRRLRMAVRAQEDEVLDPVVQRIAVAVMQLERQRLGAPFIETTLLAGVREDTGLTHPLLQVAAISLNALREDDRARRRPWARLERAALSRRVERRAAEAEPLDAFRDRVTGVVERLHRAPVVAECAALVDVESG